MIVSDILSEKGRAPLSTSPDTLLSNAVEQMVANGVGSLVVMEAEALVGIITERDILTSLAQSGDTGILQRRVAELMTGEVITCRPGDPLEAVMSLMQGDGKQTPIRHLPVIEQDKLLGVLSMRDVIGALLDESQFENQLLKKYIKDWPKDQASRH